MVQCPQKLETSDTPGARPMGCCELPDVVLGMELESSGRTVCSLNHFDQKFLK